MRRTGRAWIGLGVWALLAAGAAGCEGGGGAGDTDAAGGGEDTAAVAPGPDAVEPTADAPAAVTRPASWVTSPLRVPRNVHMTWSGDPGTTLSFTWTTTDITLDGYVPRVWIVPTARVTGEGADADMPWAPAFVHEGVGVVYRESLLGQEVGEEDYVVWSVDVSGLSPATEYTWRVGSWAGFDAAAGTFDAPELSDAYTVRSGRTKGDRGAFSVVLAGDSRGGSEEMAAQMPRLADIDAEMWFFNGDMTQSGTQVEWDVWFEDMSATLLRRPLMPVQGNHEIFANLYYHQFALPRMPDLPEELVEHAWSFDYGNVHFVGLDSNVLETVQAQVAWLDADLAAAKADPDIDWTVVMFHHPPYSASNHGQNQWILDHWTPVFDAHEVDLVFTGHDHNYERTKPIRGDAVAEDGKGTTYVVAGAFFSPAYGNGTEWWTATSTHGDKRCYVVAGFEGKRFEMTAYSGDGQEILDQLTLTK